MFIHDEMTYRFKIPLELPLVRMIGWLDRDHPFTRGSVSGEFIDRLWKLIETRNDQFDLHANVVRCIHPCNFCGKEISRTRNDGKRTMLGMSELWVPFDDIWFAAPTLIVHYVEKYSYSPPRKFIDAVMSVDFSASYNAQNTYESMCGPLMKESNLFWHFPTATE